MHRRPWPLVFLAILQFFTPLTSILISAYLNHLPPITMGRLIWVGSGGMDRFQFFFAPLLVGILILWARAWGFFLVIVYGLVVAWFNFMEWRIGQGTSVLILLGVNFFPFALIAYLCIPRVRVVFFDSRLRWWETKPRYIVNLSGEVTVKSEPTEEGTAPSDPVRALPCTVMDLSIGGGGVDSPQEIPAGTRVQVQFQFEQETFALTGVAVYGRKLATSYRFGVEWTPDSAQEKLKYRELISYFRRHRFPETRKTPEWRADLVTWLDRAKKDPQAWLPEMKAGKSDKV